MSVGEPPALGWRRDLADRRDYTPEHAKVRKLLRRLPTARGKTPPSEVDLREYLLPAADQQTLASGAVHACVAIVQYFELRASGRQLSPSRLFVYHNALALESRSGDVGVPLRSTLKAIVRFGLPPEKHWPYDAAKLDEDPGGFVYAFDRSPRSIRYVRLDSPGLPGERVLQTVKAFLAAGFPCTMGLPIPSATGEDGLIPFPSLLDTVRGGQAVAVVGYDDRLRIRSDKGALLVRNSWGLHWGEQGYGWVPYSYVTQHLAADFWTLVKSSWVRNDEFQLPQLDGQEKP